LYPVFLCRQS